MEIIVRLCAPVHKIVGEQFLTLGVSLILLIINFPPTIAIAATGIQHVRILRYRSGTERSDGNIL